VRELRNASERAVVLAAGGWIEPQHLPPGIREPKAVQRGDEVVLVPGTKIADAERELILRTLEQTGNNKAEAARRLGVDVKTVRNKLKSYRLEDQ
jgi:DNA-binding NtrC family response regulator